MQHQPKRNHRGSGRILPGIIFLILVQSCQPSVSQLQSPRSGGRLVVARSAGPKTFNRLLSFDEQSSSVLDCLNGHLIRINRQTQQPEPELAESWQAAADGKSLDFKLRRDLKFSDGHPLSVEDVMFTFQIINDPKITTNAADSFNQNNEHVIVEKLSDDSVRFRFPKPSAAALRLFDGVPILPQHVLEAAYRDGKFEDAWTLNTPLEQIVGAGAFRLASVQPGESLTLKRNGHYWKKDAAGNRLPYLDEIVVQIVADRNAQLLRFQQGETDVFSPVNVDDLSLLSDLEKSGKIAVADPGPGMIREIFWFNLNGGKDAKSSRPFLDPVKLRWFSDVNFRQAVSHAIDRTAIASVVFRGKAAPQWGLLSAADKLWYKADIRQYPYNPNHARELLLQAGFRYDAQNKILSDAEGRPVEFTLLTNAGNPLRQKMSVMIQSDLAMLGIKVNLAALESKAVLSRINETFDYEACLLALVSGDADPVAHTNIVFSSGQNHWWHPLQQQPATAWEKRLDELMEQALTTPEVTRRRQQFDEVQTILAEQQPFIFLVSRHLIVAAKSNLGNFKPALLPDFALWNCEELYLR